MRKLEFRRDWIGDAGAFFSRTAAVWALCLLFAVVLALSWMFDAARGGVIATYGVTSDSAVRVVGSKFAGARLHPTGNAAAIVIYDASEASGAVAGDREWTLLGPTTNDGKTITDLFPADDYIWCATGIYVDVKNCTAEIYRRGVITVTLRLSGVAEYTGTDITTNERFSVLTGATVAVSEEMADQLIEDFPSWWTRE